MAMHQHHEFPLLILYFLLFVCLWRNGVMSAVLFNQYIEKLSGTNMLIIWYIPHHINTLHSTFQTSFLLDFSFSWWNFTRTLISYNMFGLMLKSSRTTSFTKATFSSFFQKQFSSKHENLASFKSYTFWTNCYVVWYSFIIIDWPQLKEIWNIPDLSHQLCC